VTKNRPSGRFVRCVPPDSCQFSVKDFSGATLGMPLRR
jgi:hypothetical protein